MASGVAATELGGSRHISTNVAKTKSFETSRITETDMESILVKQSGQ